MKRFVIAKRDDKQVQEQYYTGLRIREPHVEFILSYDVSNTDDFNGRQKHLNTVIFADTQAEADIIAEDLARINPGVQYAVAEIGNVYCAPVGEPVKAKMSDDGMLPF